MRCKDTHHERLASDVVSDAFMMHSDRRCMGGCTITITGGSEVIEAKLKRRLEIRPVCY
jgi:hypothetical protein